MLTLDAIQSGYGTTKILFGVSLMIAPGEVVALLGRNGMGKTTTIRAITGFLPVTAGQLTLHGQNLAGRKTFEIAQAGIGLVPEGREIFPTLTVEENLIATARPGPWDLPAIHTVFPRLAERRRQLGKLLSGGEQQMLAIGRALMTNPRLLLLDEATEGLAPLIRAEIFACLTRLKAEGLAILVIDRSLDALSRLADRFVILEKGVSVWTGTPAALASSPAIRDRYLHL
jgi:branched-chain amino acid transport system ATP-binding protein